MFCLLALLPARPVQAGPAQGSYTVARGDCLWTIAARKDVFGDPWKWPLLLDANRSRIVDPDLIQPGWALTVLASPSASQIAAARSFARHYKEEAAAPSRASAATEAAPVPAAPVAEPQQAAAPVPPGPVQDQKPGSALPIASVFLVIALIGGIVYHKMKQGPVDEPVEAPVIVAGPAPSAPQAEAPVVVPQAEAPVVPEAAAAESVSAAPAEPAAATATGQAEPTESESLLRADQGPDPMHPEDHKNAA